MEISSVERPRAICDAVAEDKISKRSPVFAHDAILRPPPFFTVCKIASDGAGSISLFLL
jgi:hypothetical protein